MLRSKRRDYEHRKLHSMSQITVLTGPERHRRWREDERQTILAAAFAPGASVAEVARRYDVATSLIYKWRQNAASARDGQYAACRATPSFQRCRRLLPQGQNALMPSLPDNKDAIGDSAPGPSIP